MEGQNILEQVNLRYISLTPFIISFYFMTLFLLLYFNIFKTDHIVVAKVFVVKINFVGRCSLGF